MLVTLEPARDAGRHGLRTDEDEQRVRPDLRLLAGLTVPQQDGLELALAARLHDLRACPDRDARVRLDPLDEIPRHPLVERGAATDDRHPARDVREVERGLARGVRAADHDDVLAAAELGLARR